MIRSPSPAIAVTALLALSACNLAPRYQRPSATIPPSFKEAPGWRGAAPADAVAKGQWWLLFGDPVLNDLEGRVVNANQDVAAAVAAYDQARAAVREVRASLFPVIDLSTGATRAGSFGAGRPTIIGGNTVNVSSGSRRYSASIGATWEPDLFGRLRNAVSQQGALAQASQADLANVTLAAQGELALNYVQLRGIELRKAILDTTVKAYQRALTITTNRYNQGVIARVDVLQAQSQLDSARANAADLVRQRAVLEHAIAVLVGESPSIFTLPEVAQAPKSIPDVPPTLPSAVLERRPDVAAAERRVAAANAAIGIERAAFFPVFGLSGDIGTQTGRLGDLFTASSSIWSLGLSGALTLLDFGARSARVEQARAAYAQTAANYRQTALTAFQQVEDALAANRILAYVETQRASAAASANRVEALTQNQYLAGQIAYSDVIVAQTTALTAREAEVQALVDRQVSAVNLIQAIGGSWPAS
ncbi:efflux transporter outer membrane subunit [uncultured Sphingomonas sp.]|uniref:efflux transporter outer membrane subunit n=1 Tax=uncultured Sphingomonas sp. TaxID=158754 RepID=UPI0025E7061A|nr:efflux transporter outer membrane subunit [uncultured Sphingomonas sp.]